MKLVVVLLLSAVAFAKADAKTFDIDVSTGRPAASNEAFYHGETIEFRAVRGRSVVTNIEYSRIWYTTNNSSSVASDEGGWWKTDGLVFHPTNDCGAAAYRFFLEGRDEIGRDWHANGTLRLLDSPGFVPNELPLPAKVLDFSQLEVRNPPWIATLTSIVSRASRDATNYTYEVSTNLEARLAYALAAGAPVDGVVALADRTITHASQAIVTNTVPERWTWADAAVAASAGFDTTSDPTPVWDDDWSCWRCQEREFYGESGPDSTSVSCWTSHFLQSIEATVSNWTIQDDYGDYKGGSCDLTVTAVDGVTLSTPETYSYCSFESTDGGLTFRVSGPFRDTGGYYVDNYAGENGTFSSTEATGLNIESYIEVVLNHIAEHNEYSWTGATSASLPLPGQGRTSDLILILDVPSPGQTGLAPSLGLRLGNGAPRLFVQDGVDLAPEAGRNSYAFTLLPDGSYMASRILLEEVE